MDIQLNPYRLYRVVVSCVQIKGERPLREPSEDLSRDGDPLKTGFRKSLQLCETCSDDDEVILGLRTDTFYRFGLPRG